MPRRQDAATPRSASRKAPETRTLALLLAALLPVILLACIVVIQTAAEQRQRIEQEAHSQVDRVMNRVDRIISGQIEALTILALSPALDQPDLALFQRLAARVNDNNPYWRNIILADMQGNQIVNVRSPIAGEVRRIVDPSSFETLRATQRPVVGDVAPPAPISGAVAIPVRVPVLRDGKMRYALTAVLDPETLANVLQDLPRDFNGVIIDRNGRIIVRHSDRTALIGKPASDAAREALAANRAGEFRFSRTREGRSVVAVFQRSSVTGWSIHIGFPGSYYSSLQNRSVVLAIVGGLLCIGLGGVFVWILYRDLQSRRLMDRKEAQARKLEALGQLTGGVAHDFNNMLAVIGGSLELAIKAVTDPKTRRRLELARQAAEQGAGLTRQLLAFARLSPVQPVALDLGAHLEDKRKLIESSLRQDIRLVLSVEPGVGKVAVDPLQFNMAVINIAANARDAMPNGGVFTISVRNAEDGLAAGAAVEILFSDTGSGMPAEVLDRVFEPFFSTKTLEQGTGLGLSQVYGFAAQSNGSVSIESAPGQGTTVKLLLPRARQTDPAAPAAGPGKATEARDLRVLVVEDDQAVAQIAAEMLSDLGCRTQVTASAEEALAALAAEPAGFDLVFSDVVMQGGMDGIQLAREIRSRHPGLRIVLTSGNINVPLAIEDVAFLQKPYDFADLSRVLGDQMEDGSSGAAMAGRNAGS